MSQSDGLFEVRVCVNCSRPSKPRPRRPTGSPEIPCRCGGHWFMVYPLEVNTDGARLELAPTLEAVS